MLFHRQRPPLGQSRREKGQGADAEMEMVRGSAGSRQMQEGGLVAGSSTDEATADPKAVGDGSGCGGGRRDSQACSHGAGRAARGGSGSRGGAHSSTAPQGPRRHEGCHSRGFKSLPSLTVSIRPHRLFLLGSPVFCPMPDKWKFGARATPTSTRVHTFTVSFVITSLALFLPPSYCALFSIRKVYAWSMHPCCVCACQCPPAGFPICATLLLTNCKPWQVRAGAGGDEGGLFAMDLFHMYKQFADIRGWRFEVSGTGFPWLPIDQSPHSLPQHHLPSVLSIFFEFKHSPICLPQYSQMPSLRLSQSSAIPCGWAGAGDNQTRGQRGGLQERQRGTFRSGIDFSWCA